MNTEQMLKVLDELVLSYPSSKPMMPMADVADIWMKEFAQIDVSDMSDAVAAYIDSDATWFPTIKGFRKVLKRVSSQHVPEENCKCDGSGYYEAGRRQWVPCPACLPGTHERWAGGHFAPGHHCDECNKVHRADGPQQVVQEQSLVPRSAGRVLTPDERTDRLSIVSQVAKEIAAVRAKEGPARDKRLTPAQKQKIWEDRFNELIAGDTIRANPHEEVELEFAEVDIPPSGTLEHVSTEINGFEVL